MSQTHFSGGGGGRGGGGGGGGGGAAPGRRQLPRFLANIGIVVPVFPDDQDHEEAGNDEETSSVASSVATIDSSVVSETDSDASADESDFSEAWMHAIEAATDVSEDHWRSLLLLLRTQRNHFPPAIPPPSPSLRAGNSRRQSSHRRGHQAPGIAMQNAFQALAISDSEDMQDADVDLPAARAPMASLRVQCRYLKVMVKVNISDVKRKDAEALFKQKCWSEAADLFVAAHHQLHLVVVRPLNPSFCCYIRTIYLHLSRFDTTIGGLSPHSTLMHLLWTLPPLMILHFCLKTSGVRSLSATAVFSLMHVPSAGVLALNLHCLLSKNSKMTPFGKCEDASPV
jgi:hypothetical protein